MARYPGAVWRGSPNETPSGMRSYLGVVMHIMEGSLDGTDSWFHNTQAQASSHFGTAHDGRVYQWVDTNDKAWAEAAGNPYWISIENEGHSGDSLTPVQLDKCAEILAWAYSAHGVPLQVTNDPNGHGLGWHGMGGLAWGGHFDCPGPGVKAQLQQIVNRAQQLITPPPAPPSPIPVAHLTLGGQTVARYVINVPLDDQGNGYTETQIPYDKTLAVSSHAPSYPPRDHRYGHMAKAAQHEEGGNLVVFVEAGEPHAIAPIIVTAAD